MKKVLFLSLGNRDLQVDEANIKHLGVLADSFDRGNTDTDGRYVIKKAGGSFLNRSQAIFERHDDLAAFVVFPMVQICLTKVGDGLSEIVLITTHQNPADDQDCHYIALFLQKWLQSKGFQVKYRPIEFPPVELESLLEYYISLYNEYEQTDEVQLFFGNSGGTPDMRTASHMAGMFRSIQFITIQARDGGKVDTQNYDRQERLILKHIIDKMLAVYDYEGILNLPVSDDIKAVCREALGLYNLKTDVVNEKDPYDIKAANAIALILENLWVCFRQGRYADTVGRIFRIEEALGQLLLFRELKARNGIAQNGKVLRPDSSGGLKSDKSFEEIMGSRENFEKVLLYYFSEFFFFNSEKNAYYFVDFSTVPMHSGKNMYNFFFKALNIHQATYELFARINDQYTQENQLTKLRNKSYLGHGFRGVSQADVEAITGSFGLFFEHFKPLISTCIGIKVEPIFEQKNQEIKNML
jgi:hypothetical protein